MGLRDVLADFLSSEGPQSGASSETEDEDEEEETAPDPSFDVPLEDLDQEEQVENLEHRIDSMQEDLERSNSQIESIQSSQEEVAERVEDVNGTVRQLLGIYDQLTASANPFVEGGSRTQMDDDVDGFGLGGEPDGATGEMPPAEAVENEAETADPDGEADEPAADEDLADNEVVVEATEPGEEEAVSFDDLKAESSDDEQAVGDDGQQAVQSQREQEEDNADDTRLEVEPLSDEAAQMSDAAEESRSYERASRESRAGTAASRSDATLPTLADTYATDILVFEWLTDLVTSAGPAAALRAIAYYEEIGWISPEVKAYLEDTLSGPDLDMTVDPSRDPNELNAEDHAESYEYIMKLESIQQTMDDTGL
ncbi:FlaD/FlaE family flagellar protein [Haloarchaeobius litoreus]|uniref:FlaD/FlaE family flagellar protein n=1 Tax=Haloarchaeobius litoreus TaxID=755306 RepID=A0ABD6DDT0_9EURY|nr:FlaD/FlaE family flagellar protein [Haloarchaeobius litoreus]